MPGLILIVHGLTTYFRPFHDFHSFLFPGFFCHIFVVVAACHFAGVSCTPKSCPAHLKKKPNLSSVRFCPNMRMSFDGVNAKTDNKKITDSEWIRVGRFGYCNLIWSLFRFENLLSPFRLLCLSIVINECVYNLGHRKSQQ